MSSLKKILFAALSPLAAGMFALAAGGLLIYFTGHDPLDVYARMFEGTFGSSYGAGQVLFKSTPLIFTGLSVAIAFKAGLFNIGAEGQLNAGAFLTAWAGFTFLWMPGYMLIPLCIAAGFIGGAFWGAIAGYLKERFGAHEVINTIMLNFVALALVSYLVNEVYSVRATIHTPGISPAAVIPRFEELVPFFKGSPFNLSFIIAVLCCLLMYYVTWKTPLGYELRTLGLNRNAAEYAHMNIKKLTLISMAAGGGFAGLAGTNFVMGYKHYFELGFSEGAGYIGIAVALIARNNPAGIIPAALFFGILEYGGLTINTIVPKELVTIIQGLAILAVITAPFIMKKIRGAYD